MDRQFYDEVLLMEEQMEEKVLSGLSLLRAPFPPNQIGKLPKPTKKQTEELKANFKLGQRCKECGGWHQPEVVHLDYVGHAALTDRLLDTDPQWFWEPLALKDGLPAFDADGGLWIKLTVCGVTRLGYGNAAESEYKDIGSRQKEVIGDALRNAAMRFGAALELWHKGDLHTDEDDGEKKKVDTPGQIVEQNLAMERLEPMVAKAVRDESAKITADFYTIGAKAATGSWNVFLKTAGEDEIDACWKLLDSKVRSAIKKVNDGAMAGTQP
jgi:hypothetical protein